MSKENTKEGPGTDSPQQFKPGNAGSLPTKHYPSTTKMGTGGPHNSVEGPCNDNHR
jgi:hypothetical protein